MEARQDTDLLREIGQLADEMHGHIAGLRDVVTVATDLFREEEQAILDVFDTTHSTLEHLARATARIAELAPRTGTTAGEAIMGE